MKICILTLAVAAALGLLAEYPDRFVEYIESDGSQYINLGDVLRSNTVATVDFMLMAKDTVERAMFGADYAFAYLATTRRYVRGKLGYSGPAQDARFLHRYDVAAQKVYQSTDSGASWTQVSVNNNSERGEGAGANARLFWAYGSTQPKASMRVYGCSITNGTAAVCDLYPCVKNGEPGLYDTVSGAILYDTANSAVAFAVGADIDIPPACADFGCRIVVEPSLFGVVLPGSGVTKFDEAGPRIFSLSGADGEGRYFDASGSSRAEFDYAEFIPVAGEAERIESVSFTRQVAGIVRVVWHFKTVQCRFHLNASAVGEADYTVNGQAVAPGAEIWVSAGEELVIRAVARFGSAFVRWMSGSDLIGEQAELRLTIPAGGLDLTPVLKTYICVNRDSVSDTEDGSAAHPYKTIQAGLNAIDEDGKEVVVVGESYPVRYEITSQLVNNVSYMGVLRGVTGNPKDVIIDAGGNGRCLKFTDGSTVSALTFTNGFLRVENEGDERNGGGVYLEGGSSMENCVVTDCAVECDYGENYTAGAQYGGGGVYAVGVANGTPSVISGSVIENCRYRQINAAMSGDQYVYGGGVYSTGAIVLTNSVFRGCVASVACGQYAGRAYGGGFGAYTAISKPASRIVDCAFVENSVTNVNDRSNRVFGGAINVYDRNANPWYVTGTVFTNNLSIYQGGAVAFLNQPGHFRDCVYAGNLSYGSSGALLMSRGGSVTNSLFVHNGGVSVVSVDSNRSLGVGSCTFADNTASGAILAVGTPALATVRNSIFFDTCEEAFAEGVVFDHCLIGVDPNFKARTKGDYRPKYASPCRGQGLVEPWMATATDMAGAPRLDPKDGSVDIGCYQHTPLIGFSVLVK